MKFMKKRILRILFGALILVSAIITERYFRQIGVILYLVSYFLIGGDILFNAVRNILRGSVFDENFLMALATVGAMFISEYTEGIAVMLLYQIGEMFQDYAVDKSRKSIADLMNIRPDHANVKVDELW